MDESALKELRSDMDLLKEQMAQMVEMMEAMNILVKAKAVETASAKNFVQGTIPHPPGLGFTQMNVQKINAQGQAVSATAYLPQNTRPIPPYGLPHNYTPQITTDKLDFHTAIPTITTSNIIRPQIRAHELPRPQPQSASGLQPFHFAIGENPPTGDAKAKLESLEERLRVIERGNDCGFRDVIDLCLVPDVEIPPKFKVPKFEKYGGSSCPKIHLKMYCRKMGKHVKNEKLLIHFFQESLTGAAMNWYINLEPSRIRSWRDLAEAFMKQYQYNSNMAPDRLQLQSLSKMDDESFRSYAYRWRKLASQVEPPMLEKEMALMFLDTLTSPFYSRMVGYVYANFADLVSAGERIDEGLKNGRFSQGFVREEASENSSKEKEAEAQTISNQGRKYHPSIPYP